jgi:dTMP kinase
VHLVTALEQRIDDVRADEARASGHDRPHAPYRTAAVFLSFEGVDGSGKTTQANLLADALRAEGRDVVATREPGGTPLGEQVRRLLLGGLEMSPWAEASLFAAARAELVDRVIAPALEAGQDVVCDRYIDSSLAYQGIARGLGVERVLELNLVATRGLLPDRTFLVLVDPEVAITRSSPSDRIEREGEQFHRAVDEAYRSLAEMFPQRITTVDGNRAPAAVAEEIRGRLRDLS